MSNFFCVDRLHLFLLAELCGSYRESPISLNPLPRVYVCGLSLLLYSLLYALRQKRAKIDGHRCAKYVCHHFTGFIYLYTNLFFYIYKLNHHPLPLPYRVDSECDCRKLLRVWFVVVVRRFACVVCVLSVLCGNRPDNYARRRPSLLVRKSLQGAPPPPASLSVLKCGQKINRDAQFGVAVFGRRAMSTRSLCEVLCITDIP